MNPGMFLKIALVVFCLISNVLSADLDGKVDAAYKASPATFAFAACVAAQPDGKYLVGGSFNVVNGAPNRALVRFNADGTRDETFNPPISGAVHAIRLLPDGRILVGGGATTVNGQQRIGINRLNPDGTPDATFNVGGVGATGGIVAAIALQADGKILIGGTFETVNNVSRSRLARLNADGTLDTSFSVIVSTNDSNYAIRSIVVQPNGQLIIGGSFTMLNSVPKSNIARLNADATLDNSFTAATPLNTIVNDMELLPDGKLIIVGTFTQVNGTPKSGIAKLNASGTLDNAFNASIFNLNYLPGVVVQADGKIILTGNILQVNGVNTGNIARLNADGTRDNTFTATADSATADVVPSDNPVVVGFFSKLNNTDRFGVGRLDSSGNLDASFNPSIGSYGIVRKLLPQPDGKVLIGGKFTGFGNVARRNIARLNEDGSLDLSFNPGSGAGNSISDTVVYDISLAANSKIALAGNFTTFNGVARRAVAILNSDGSLDASFNANVTQGEVTKAVFYAGNKLLITGVFRLSGGTQNVNLALLNPDGTRDTSFMPTFTGGNPVAASAVQPDGKILVSGLFSAVNGVPRTGIVRLNGDGSLDDSFNLNTPGYSIDAALEIFVQPDGKLLMTGNFRRNDGYTVPLMRLNADGTRDLLFNLLISRNFRTSFTVQPDGRILVILNEGQRPKVIRLKTNGSIDYSFNLNSSGIIGFFLLNTIAVQTNNKILVGGEFTDYDNVLRSSLVRLNNQPLPASTFFDYDGDGKADLSVFRPSNGYWYLSNSSNNAFIATQFGAAGDLLAPGDFDGDARADISVFRPADGGWYRLNSSNDTFSAVQFGTNGDLPAPGDFDGDGKADLTVFRPSAASWYRVNSSNNQFIAAQFGASGDKPLVGDFDGDGKADLSVFRPADGGWYRVNSAVPFAFVAVQFGTAEDKPVAADYDGDGKTDLAVFRPSVGDWYILNSSDSSFTGQHFGVTEDKPAPADFDGDGRADLVVFRPSSGIWYLLRTTAGFTGIQFGATGDIPAPGAFVR